MKEKLMVFLKAAKIFDQDNTLSLSNVAFAVVITKLALAAALDWAIIVPFALTLLNHNGRKFWRAKEKAKDVADKAALEKLQADVRTLTNAANFKR
jgi:hypothetical protein